MTEHLTDEQMAEWLAGGSGDAAAQQHLAECRECSDEMSLMRSGVAGFAALVHEEAQRRPLRQVAVPAARTARHTPALVWAAALALLVVATWMFRWTPTAPQPSAIAQASGEDTLLLEIQEDLNREVPDALAPALVLTAERNRIIGQEARNQNR